jgi:methionine-rich copper-binding protein CopC
MKVIDRPVTRRLVHQPKTSRRFERRRAGEAFAARRAPQLEPLETRSLLSTVLNGFPAAGFRGDALADMPPWDVAVIVDSQRISARGFAELSEHLPDAPGLTRSEGAPDWIAGIIGDTQLRGSDADTNDVDIYRIDLPAGDHYAVNLQVLAQRFDSSLDPAVSILDENGDTIASNDDALHVGFAADAELFTGLNGGTYYVAVYAGGNLPGEGGFDPHVPGSAHNSRGTTGQYLLHVDAVPDTTRPTVVDTNIERDSTLRAVPTEITVRFSEPMHLSGLQHGATLTSGNGDSIELTPTHYDTLAREVTYLLLDRPVAGDYQFTLHAAQVQDRADNPIDGGGPGGDFVLQFHLDTPSVDFVDTESNDTAATAQPLGPLFANELIGQTGVQITGSVTATSASGDHDFYRFQVTRAGLFTFRLTPGQGTTQTGVLRLRDATGKQLAQAFKFGGFGSTMFRWLTPGEYLLEMDASSNTPDGSYQLSAKSSFGPDLLLTDNDPGPVVQVVLRTHDGEKSTESETASSSEASTLTLSPISYAVSSLPAVASQPAGQPQQPAAGSTELAWVDRSQGGQALPAGFVFGEQATGPAVRFSVNGVSGTFHDSLPDAVPHGMHALNPSAQLVSELASLLRGGFDGGATGSSAAVDDTGFVGDSGGEYIDLESAEWVSDAADLAMSPPTLALGMVASIGAASALNVPNRRRSNWVQRAFELLGAR